MLSPKNKRRFLQILPFGVISAVLSILYVFIEKGILGSSPIYPSTGNPYHPNFILSVALSFIIGIAIGAIEIFLLKKWFQKSSFFMKIVLKTATYMVLIIIFNILVSSIGHAVELNVGLLDQEVLTYLSRFMSDLAFWSIVLFIAFGIGLCLYSIWKLATISVKAYY